MVHTRDVKHQQIFLWATVLLLSTLPNIIWQEFFGPTNEWLLFGKLIFLAILIVVSFFVDPIRPFRKFYIVLLGLFLAEELLSQVGHMAWWQNWLASFGSSFTVEMFGIQIRRVVVALLMIGFLFLLRYKARDFFFVKGDLDAPTERVGWLGIDEGKKWNQLGLFLSVVISLGTLLFLVLAGRPSLAALGQALPILPFVLVFAAMNAFAEELNYRAALLAPLLPVVGKHQSILLMAVFFGLGHYYGVPYGIIGVVMAGFLGWILSKSMLETKGFFWPWFIHFCQDVLIFSFMAIGSITPGG